MYSARQLRCVALGLVLSVAAGLFAAAPARADYDTYAAIAYSKSTGHYGYGYGYYTLAAAELEALSNCEGDDAQIVVWSCNNWCALAIGDDNAYGWYWAGTSYEARAGAVLECQKNTSSDHIKVIVVYSGD